MSHVHVVQERNTNSAVADSDQNSKRILPVNLKGIGKGVRV